MLPHKTWVQSQLPARLSYRWCITIAGSVIALISVGVLNRKNKQGCTFPLFTFCMLELILATGQTGAKTSRQSSEICLHQFGEECGISLEFIPLTAWLIITFLMKFQTKRHFSASLCSDRTTRWSHIRGWSWHAKDDAAHNRCRWVTCVEMIHKSISSCKHYREECPTDVNAAYGTTRQLQVHNTECVFLL